MRVAIIIRICSNRSLVLQLAASSRLLLPLLLLLLPLMVVCRVYTTQTSRVIYDELALVRFTRSVRPSVRPLRALWTSLTTRRAGSPGYRWARDSRPGQTVSGWLGLCDACKRRNNARCRKFIARGVEMKIERVLTDRQTDRPSGRLRVEMPPRRGAPLLCCSDRPSAMTRRAGGDTARPADRTTPPSPRPFSAAEMEEPRRRGLAYDWRPI